LKELEAINQRPKPFEFYTAADLWTDEHTSKQMLACHLDENIDLSSRNSRFIKRSVDWIARTFAIGSGVMIADFGCGPGLYAQQLARCGASLTGIDFSSRSIDYARDQAAKENLPIQYFCQNYLDFETDERFDLILMIFCDLCALSPVQRSILLKKFRTILKPGGKILLDVCSMAGYAEREETSSIELSEQNGFWSPNRYYCFLNTFKYDEEKVILDKYTLIEADRVRTVYNWLQYFSPEALGAEFGECGLKIDQVMANVAGDPYDPSKSEFAIIAGLP
jgi:2-polyprenyl-3-methyl-5-hydroxy-6-metoxy-1,4-benzoquinol methylase